MLTQLTRCRPIYLQTSYAFYVLGKPSHLYETAFRQFYQPHRIAQLVISTATHDKALCTKATFYSSYCDLHDVLLDGHITEEMVSNAVSAEA